MATRLRPRPQQGRPSQTTAKQSIKQKTRTEQESQKQQEQAAKETAVISTATTITQEQSTEMLQTAMHASLSALAYLRNWFPVRCFDEIIYMSADAHWSYDDYAAGRFEAGTVASSHCTPMRVMRRGRSSRTDNLLDWLEHGVFDALQKGYLRAMQVSIFQDPKQQSNVLESYTFTVNYAPADAASGRRRVTSLHLQSPRGSNTTSDIMSVQRVRGLMQAFVRQVMTSTFGLDLLPDVAFLRMHLHYTEDCPEEYEPPYFQASTDTNMFFPDNGLVKTGATVKGMRSGYHTMSFKISHLNQTDVSDAEDCSQYEPSGGFQYNTRVSRQEEIEVDDCFHADNDTTSMAPQRTHKDASRSSPLPASTLVEMPQSRSTGSVREHLCSLVMDESVPSGLNTAMRATTQTPETRLHQTALPTRGRDTASLTTTSPETQDLQIIRDLQNMIPPSGQQNYTQDTQRVADSTQDPYTQKCRMQLLPSTVNELEKRRSVTLGLRSLGPSVREKMASRDLCEGGEKVRCECGGTHEDSCMLFCSFCKTLQHIYCYGFYQKDDTKRLGEYACYACLFQERDPAKYKDLRALAIRRRGIRIIEDSGYLNDKEFNSVLGCNDAKFRSNMIQDLKNKGYLVYPLGLKKKRGKRMTVCERGELRDGMVREFFDPITGVAEHYERSSSERQHSTSQNSSRPERSSHAFQKSEGSRDLHSRNNLSRGFRGAGDVEDDDLEMEDNTKTPKNLRTPVSGRKRVRETQGSLGPNKRIKSSFSNTHLSMGEYTPSCRGD